MRLPDLLIVIEAKTRVFQRYPSTPDSRIVDFLPRNSRHHHPRQGGEAGHGLPKPMTGILDVLLDLPLLPTRRRIAEIGLEQEVADHG